jgi:ATP-dependent RNA helicase DDX31/DBP7
VGRAARAGKAGHSLLFLLPSEKGYLDVLQTKGVSNLAPLSLASTLNQAAVVCDDWTTAGRVHGGGESKKVQDRRTNSSRLGEYFSAEVQFRLEDCVVQDDIAAKVAEKQKEREEKESTTKGNKKKRRKKHAKAEGQLLELARTAFLSFLRAYSTKKEPAVRSIFTARALHLGHVARSFALKEPPKSLASKHRHSKDKEQEQMDMMDEEANKPQALDFSRLDENLIRHNLSDNDDDDARPSKRPKLKQQQQGGKGQNAKYRLLENARKMQNNLMDAM